MGREYFGEEIHNGGHKLALEFEQNINYQRKVSQKAFYAQKEMGDGKQR